MTTPIVSVETGPIRSGLVDNPGQHGPVRNGTPQLDFTCWGSLVRVRSAPHVLPDHSVAKSLPVSSARGVRACSKGSQRTIVGSSGQIGAGRATREPASRVVVEGGHEQLEQDPRGSPPATVPSAYQETHSSTARIDSRATDTRRRDPDGRDPGPLGKTGRCQIHRYSQRTTLTRGDTSGGLAGSAKYTSRTHPVPARGVPVRSDLTACPGQDRTKPNRTHRLDFASRGSRLRIPSAPPQNPWSATGGRRSAMPRGVR